MRIHLRIAAVILVSSTHTAFAQFSQQGPKLQGSGYVGRANQGTVAVSADGSTAIVGGSSDDGGAGAVWIWTRSGDGWSQQATKLVGSGAEGKAGQGATVAISGDGNTAIVGGPNDDPAAQNGTAGAVWIWTRNGGVWTQQGPKLVGSGAAGNARQGAAVAISAEGNTVIVGGTDDNHPLNAPAGIGAAWVWTRSAGVWTQQGNKLVGSGYAGTPIQGRSVALSADGNTAIIGGYYDSGSRGATWVWTRNAGVWTQQGSKLVAAGTATVNVFQGNSVALSADGNTAVIGGETDNDFTGAAWVWTRNAGIWTQQGPKLVGAGIEGYEAEQGASVSLSADGNTAIVGGPADNNYLGAAWIWTRSAGIWTQQGRKLIGSDAAGDSPEQGDSVSLSGDGNTAFVGGYYDKDGAGAAWVWTRGAEGGWRQQGAKLVGSAPEGGVFQGCSVSLSADGDTAIVGGDGDNGLDGAAWVWTRNAGTWSQQRIKLVASDALGRAAQGQSVSLSADGNTAIAGGPGDDNDAGAAWIWTRSTGVWTEEAKLVGSGAVGKGRQGSSVSLSADGNTAIVGGPGAPIPPPVSPFQAPDVSSSGAAWIWTRSNGSWTQQAKLFSSGAAQFARQGVSVALSADGNTAIVGSEDGAWVWTRSQGSWAQQGAKLAARGSVALSADGNTAVIGVYVWTRSGGLWTRYGTGLIGSDAAGETNQGTSVSLSADGNTAVIGGPNDNAVDFQSSYRYSSPYQRFTGATWVWRRSQGVWRQLESKLVGSGASFPQQGSAVAISFDGSTIIVGGTNDDHGGVGAAWVFSTATVPTPQKHRAIGH
ncbi:MAG TPA: hypothetical protein VN380_22120 [Thermoanaerobaculia bacterium]|jgi:hypothetical protein|nr:hypothetical protein [Thermoanaerobaculia bacterium]